MMVVAPACGGLSPTSEHYAYEPEMAICATTTPLPTPLCPGGGTTEANPISQQQTLRCGLRHCCVGRPVVRRPGPSVLVMWPQQGLSAARRYDPCVCATCCRFCGPPSSKPVCSIILRRGDSWLSFADSSAGDGFCRKASLGQAPSAAGTGAVCCGRGGGGRGSPSSGGASSRWPCAEGGGAPPLLPRLAAQGAPQVSFPQQRSCCRMLRRVDPSAVTLALQRMQALLR